MEKQVLTEVTPPGEETEKTDKELIQEIVEATSDLHDLSKIFLMGQFQIRQGKISDWTTSEATDSISANQSNRK